MLQERVRQRIIVQECGGDPCSWRAAPHPERCGINPDPCPSLQAGVLLL